MSRRHLLAAGRSTSAGSVLAQGAISVAACTAAPRVVLATCLYVLLLLSSLGFGQTPASRSAEIRKYIEQGKQALKENRPDAAADTYHSILRIDPTNVEARANLGVVAMVRRDWASAATELRKAHELQPSNQKVKALLGLCYVHLGRLPESTKLLSDSFPQLQDKKLQLEAGLQLLEIWYQGGELEKAAQLLSQLQKFQPDNPAVLYASHRVHSDLAFQALYALALNAPDSVQLHRALAQHMVNEGHAPEAITEYREALEKSPREAGLHYELGQAILADSHLEASLANAQKEFQSALALNPSDARCECMLGQIEVWRTSPKTALDHYDRALQLNPEIVCAKLGLAGLLIDEGKPQEALAHLQSAARSDPYNAEVRHRLSVLYRSLGQKQDADREMAAFRELEKVQGQLQKALQQGPSN